MSGAPNSGVGSTEPPESGAAGLAGGGSGKDEFTPILPGAGASDYERYLRTDELLALQKGPDEWVHRDELLFQT
ncbi:MAG TPA: hypothetical protein VJQ85_11515, partial [Gaiellaceae bacterium]|nr:hypothetical protein [Gaiellaceae bacterium]